MKRPSTQRAPKPWEHAKASGGSADDPLAMRFLESLSYDRRLYKQDIAGSLAHVRMLHRVGQIQANDLAAIDKGLKEIEAQIDQQGDAWPGWKIELEDVHMCIETALIDLIGDAGRKLHTGRSRNDQVALDLKLWIEDAAAQLQRRFEDIFRALVDLAKRDGKIVMPSYTHLQRAQPIVVGAELMAWLTALDRALGRVRALQSINCDNPLGAGAIAGSSLPLDRHDTAESLQIGRPSSNSIDATASRDAAIDFVYALAMIAMTLSRWAEQWILYASSEFDFITLDGRYTTGSSMMPQKQNPDMLELIRGRCGGVYGQLIALLTMCKGLSIGYQRDLQEDKRCVFAAYDSVHDALGILARIVATTKFNASKIERRLENGFLDATSLAEYLVTRGVAFRSAHQVVGQLVQMCQGHLRKVPGKATRNQTQEPPGRLAALSLDDFNRVCAAAGFGENVCQRDVYDWLGAENVVKRYQTAGNAGLSGFAEQFKAWEARLNDTGRTET